MAIKETELKCGKRYIMPMRHWLWIPIAFILILVGCQRTVSDSSDITVDLATTPSPPVVGLATITVVLNNASRQPVQGARVELEGNMSHAGMAAVTAQAREVAPGRYAADLDFSMSGDWVIVVRATLPDGRTVERQMNVGSVSTR